MSAPLGSLEAYLEIGLVELAGALAVVIVAAALLVRNCRQAGRDD